MIDTHAHLYDSQFDSDRTVMIQRSIDQGVNKIFLPNTDVDSVEGMMALQKQFPENCFPMIGLHPCDVKEDYLSQLEKLYEWLKKYNHTCPICRAECGEHRAVIDNNIH